MQNRLKLGGILVLPLNDQLMRIKRVSECRWEETMLLPFSIASALQPPIDFHNSIKPIEVAPLPLQMLCRSVIRNNIRKKIKKEHISVNIPSNTKVPKDEQIFSGILNLFVRELDNDQQPGAGERNMFIGDDMRRGRQITMYNRRLGTAEHPSSETEISRSNPSLHDEGFGTIERLSMETDEQDTEYYSHRYVLL
uniref:Uncharacterized protein n=1 Tax=Dendroctonus ponderosae TaxID=77166 RepID=A0AAR5P1E8_DENPD